MRPAPVVVGAGVLATAAVLLLAGPAADGGAAPPTGLSITLTDGVGKVRPGSTVTYRAVVTNRGPKAVGGRLALELPPYAEAAAVGGASAPVQRAAWTVTVRAGASVARTATVRIGHIPTGQVRVTALASLYPRGQAGAPLIRTADADHIQGVSDAPATAASSAAPSAGASAAPGPSARGSRPDDRPTLWLVVGLPALVALLLAGGLWWRRRRKTASA